MKTMNRKLTITKTTDAEAACRRGSMAPALYAAYTIFAGNEMVGHIYYRGGWILSFCETRQTYRRRTLSDAKNKANQVWASCAGAQDGK